MNWFKRGLILLFVYFFLLGSYKVYDHFTDDFRIANITDDLPFRPEYEVASLSADEKRLFDVIIDQRFHYLGKGGQTYAFTSDDEKYVLKLFKFKHHRPKLIPMLLPSIGPLKKEKERHFAKAEWKYHAPFKGYKLAYDQHRKESGLLFVHLNRTENLQRIVVVTDKLGFMRTIDLDSYAFAIQKKGETFENVLTHYLDQHDIEAAKDCVRKMYALYRLEYERGLFDRDFCVMRNTGFVEDEAIRIDIGQLCPEAHHRSLEEHMAVVHERLAEFLHKKYPQHTEELLSLHE